MDSLGRYELIFVNDGSRDDTLALLKKIAAEDKTVKVINFSRNFRSSGGRFCGNGKIIRRRSDYNRLRPFRTLQKLFPRWLKSGSSAQI